MASVSRWLVGSSMMKKSASVASMRVRATRFTSPPESVFIVCKPSPREKAVSSWRILSS